MKNFLQTNEHSDKTIKELSHLIYRIEAHIYRGELGPASSLLASVEERVQRLKDQLQFPTSTVLIGSQLGFLSGGSLRGRLPGAILGAALGWLYGQQAASKAQQDIEVLNSRISDLHHLLAVQAHRLSER